MEQKYEYKFIRLGEGFLGFKKRVLKEYQDVITEHSEKGWRLVQVFAPSVAAYGEAKFIEIILEREVQN